MPGPVSLRNGVKFTEWASGVTAAPRLRGAAAVQQPLRIAVGSERVHWAPARARRRSQISHLDRQQPFAQGKPAPETRRGGNLGH